MLHRNILPYKISFGLRNPRLFAVLARETCVLYKKIRLQNLMIDK